MFWTLNNAFKTLAESTPRRYKLRFGFTKLGPVFTSNTAEKRLFRTLRAITVSTMLSGVGAILLAVLSARFTLFEEQPVVVSAELFVFGWVMLMLHNLISTPAITLRDSLQKDEVSEVFRITNLALDDLNFLEFIVNNKKLEVVEIITWRLRYTRGVKLRDLGFCKRVLDESKAYQALQESIEQ